MLYICLKLHVQIIHNTTLLKFKKKKVLGICSLIKPMSGDLPKFIHIEVRNVDIPESISLVLQFHSNLTLHDNSWIEDISS